MITKIKKVHYCEFCKKRGFMKPTMEKHEKHCTANLDRTCRMCEVTTLDYRILIKKYNEQFKIQECGNDFDDWEHILETPKAEDIMKEVNDCPACALTIVRNLKHSGVEFNFKEECAKYWESVNIDSVDYPIY